MIFRHILLDNIFSYRHAEFDFKGAGSSKNIVLIFGRNGFGKTSFINAVKLLFVGTNNDMRSSVMAGALLSAEHYILGMGEEWMGIFNARARREGEKACRIRLIFEEDGTEVEVERRWELITGSGYTEKLEIDVRGESARHLTGEGAQQFLNERLPEDYIPFFFFDGEQIQKLAEANRSQTAREIERLLQLAPLDTLVEYLDKVGREWRKQDMPLAAQALLRRLEREKAEFESKMAIAYERKEGFHQERADLERIIKQEDLYLDSKRAGTIGVEEGKLRSDLVRVSEDLENLQLRITETLPANAFLIANPLLVRRTLDELDYSLSNPAGAQIEVLESIIESLPESLFRPPSSMPPLTDTQVRFYRERLTRLLQAYVPNPPTETTGLIKLDPSPAKQLRSLLEYALNALNEREDRARQLKEAVRLKERQRELVNRLDDISNMPKDEQQEYLERKAKNDERKNRFGAIGPYLHDLENEIADLTKRIDAKEVEIRAQEKKVIVSEKNRLRLDRAEKLKRFFQRYKDELKKRKRGAVEMAVNNRFKELMTSHNLIANIRVDDLFGVHYLDADGNPFGMASISAGMKQLAATALLWALKEVSGKEVPLVIDTPLGRIDRGNQDNLLTQYYPKAGGQVIILPTDSEIDESKHKLIAPYVYREYRLENSVGQDTRVVELPSVVSEVTANV